MKGNKNRKDLAFPQKAHISEITDHKLKEQKNLDFLDN
jgi:hypothetical protein